MRFLRQVTLVALLAAPIFTLGWTATVSAANFRSDSGATVAKDETLDDTLYIQGSTITVAGTVNGDVYCLGQNVTISGTVNGDVICAGQSIRVGGTVNGDIRVAAQFVEVSGKVDSNATVAAQSFALQSGGAITGDATLMGGAAEISGTIGRDLVGSLDQLTVAGQTGRDVQVEVEQLVLSSTAKVNGALNYESNKDAQVQNGASAQGGLNRQDAGAEENSAGNAWTAFGYTLVSLLAVSMMLVLLAPRLFHSVSEEGRLRLGRSLLAGVLGVVAIPVVIILLMFSIIGAPLGILLGLLWAVLLFLSGPAMAYYLGRLVMRSSNNALIYMLAGSLLLLVLSAIPIINALVVIAVLVLGGGMLIGRVTRGMSKPAYALETSKGEK